MLCIYAAVLIKVVNVSCTFQSFSVKKSIAFKGTARHTVYDSTNTKLLSTRTCRKQVTCTLKNPKYDLFQKWKKHNKLKSSWNKLDLTFRKIIAEWFTFQDKKKDWAVPCHFGFRKITVTYMACLSTFLQVYMHLHSQMHNACTK